MCNPRAILEMQTCDMKQYLARRVNQRKVVVSCSLFSCILVVWLRHRMLNNIMSSSFAYPQIGWMSEFTLSQSSIVANTEDWPLLDTEGSCGGPEVEQREKKTNNEWCSASWITAHVESQFVMINRNVLYVSLSMKKTWTGYVASRSLFSLYLATHYQLFTSQISWGMRL